MKAILAILATLALPAAAQTNSPWTGLDFLKGTWIAKTTAPAGVTASGSYTFRSELGGHAMARYSTRDAGCKAPENFDCEHGDALTIFQEGAGQPLKAIYFDNEGHVLHYDVSTPSPNVALFLSDPAVPGPRLRLQYELHGTNLAGKFQMQLPGQTEWKSYLEWNGPKR